ncbi:IS110 family transposase [Desulfosarcina ovata]|uniref:IS110 family transposase ISSto5 n=1 Tax=Desulfosarcina ovata subsp. ovata TaxID=2752305 RepID=A0A5K8AMJ1_9BACT|nr:IS110 family transposase [Desulfosarcina ovata]BBO93060.1 IS110 family transposase ISSto5 [Desulfosarcina ovata subsp. ovata]
MKTYAGIDLHSSNSFIGVINQNDEKLHSRRHYNNLKEILKVLRKYKKSLQGVVVESTYNWYWLVDGLMEQEYKVHLANPTAIQQYKGLKNRDDKYDAFWLAHLLRLGILPQGYIYPKSLRPVRDLFRRRTLFVKQRTAQTLSLQSMIARNRGIEHSASVIVHLDDESYEEMFDCPNLVSTALHQIGTIRFLEKQIKEIEAEVETVVELDNAYRGLLTIPGIGKILAMTIMLEVGDIRRFEKVGNYSSYCRCVKAQSTSNGKKKSNNNRKNGNRYLSWAYVEAANHNKRSCPLARKFIERKTAEKNYTVAIKALANKLSKASYFIMRDQTIYDPSLLFG